MPSMRMAYVLIGGFAAIAHGDVAPTFDVDVVPDPTPENLERMAADCNATGRRTGPRHRPAGSGP